jgi:hypothetical protein
MDDPFSRMQDPTRRANRYSRRVAEEYRLRAEGELRVLERESATATARS